jgi:hypothetical protein
MSAEKTPPAEGTYRFVLRKQVEHDPTMPEIVSGYDESVITRDITHPDGVRRRTVYVNSESFRTRLVRLGWLDVTDKFSAAGGTGPVSTPSPQKPNLSAALTRPRVPKTVIVEG